jgi:SlyX protein
MTPTSAAEHLEQRLEALEIKASFTEDLVDKLEQIIVRQQETLDALVAQVLRLREQAASAPEGSGARQARDDLPPHY